MARKRKRQKVNHVFQGFEQLTDTSQPRLEYCCGQQYYYVPQKLKCSRKEECYIAIDAVYFSNKDWKVCESCYNADPPDTLNLPADDSTSEEAKSTRKINKAEFIICKNNVIEAEPIVHCIECGRKYHQICVLYVESFSSVGFTCSICKPSKINRFTAKNLSPSYLGIHIERHVNKLLQKKGVKDAQVTIRVVSSSDKTLVVRPHMKTRYVNSGSFPETFPFRSKTILAFQTFDGYDVSIFGMYVQEYGSDCPQPNTRRVYIAYLDSVQYFKPREHRTDVFHEIILSYLSYVKKEGFRKAHIWACPPRDGDDYIFHRHPPEQKVPSAKRLQEWYKAMLDKGMKRNIILNFKDPVAQAKDDNCSCVTELAYFEGDFWPGVIEEVNEELEKEEVKKREEEKKRQEKKNSKREILKCLIKNVSTDITKINKGRGRPKKNPVKHKPRRNKSSSPALSNDDLSQRIYSQLQRRKNHFFIIQLSESSDCVQDIIDPDEVLVCDLMDGRDAFLDLCRDNHYEFTTLRRARYSTLVLLQKLHQEAEEEFYFNCNNCKRRIQTRFFCWTCEDFDLCMTCYAENKHEHPMDKAGVPENEFESFGAQNLHRMRKSIALLTHATNCKTEKCRKMGCKRMKAVLRHVAQRRTKLIVPNWGLKSHDYKSPFAMKCDVRNCSVCFQVGALCFEHARQCRVKNCQVIFCETMKKKIGQRPTHPPVQIQEDDFLVTRIRTALKINQPEDEVIESRPIASPSHEPQSFEEAISTTGIFSQDTKDKVTAIMSLDPSKGRDAEIVNLITFSPDMMKRFLEARATKFLQRD